MLTLVNSHYWKFDENILMVISRTVLRYWIWAALKMSSSGEPLKSSLHRQHLILTVLGKGQREHTTNYCNTAVRSCETKGLRRTVLKQAAYPVLPVLTAWEHGSSRPSSATQWNCLRIDNKISRFGKGNESGKVGQDNPEDLCVWCPEWSLEQRPCLLHHLSSLLCSSPERSTF